MRRSTKLQLRQLLVIILVWMFFGFMLTLYDHLVLHSLNSAGVSPEYSFLISSIRNIGAGLIGGLLGGSLLVFYINVRYQDKPYAHTILAVFFAFILVVGIITVIMAFTLVPMKTHRPLSDPLTQAALIDFFLDPTPLKQGLVWSFIVGITQLFLQVSYKFGQGSFWNIIFGKYQIPKMETKIFMFLDLNSSTAMAERLGNEQYHLFLRDFFADITQPILENKGIIYQYVGDEVVISWNFIDGIEKNNCIRCFFDIKQKIQEKEGKYTEKYGVLPSFKAGIHCGKVVVGEIGIIKRDITYSGDVLNTTARVQGMCKEFNVELIASGNLIDELKSLGNYLSSPLGFIKLRGKSLEISLNELRFTGSI